MRGCLDPLIVVDVFVGKLQNVNKPKIQIKKLSTERYNTTYH